MSNYARKRINPHLYVVKGWVRILGIYAVCKVLAVADRSVNYLKAKWHGTDGIY